MRIVEGSAADSLDWHDNPAVFRGRFIYSDGSEPMQYFTGLFAGELETSEEIQPGSDGRGEQAEPERGDRGDVQLKLPLLARFAGPSLMGLLLDADRHRRGPRVLSRNTMTPCPSIRTRFARAPWPRSTNSCWFAVSPRPCFTAKTPTSTFAWIPTKMTRRRSFRPTTRMAAWTWAWSQYLDRIVLRPQPRRQRQCAGGSERSGRDHPGSQPARSGAALPHGSAYEPDQTGASGRASWRPKANSRTSAGRKWS
ncbi:MAG: hypothetical protein MZV64_71000 [Ignavibacteriales bacterium]|nr:hypothetical protein [Ignavibacteriales bacterium]